MDRVVVIVMDSVGVGALPDADKYGDVGSNTLLHVAQYCEATWHRPLHIGVMASLGMGNILDLPGVGPATTPTGAFGKMAEVSAGKDTTTGHWELMGIVSENPFPTYPTGFSNDLIDELRKRIGRPLLGNEVASGTEIITRLGEKHVKTGSPIVYTSVDSVMQIAAHEDVIPLDELYRICRTARELLTGVNAVARVIARPFMGPVGSFVRTGNRRDFSLLPPKPTVLDRLVASGRCVTGIGKIEDIFAGQGLTHIEHTTDNPSSLVATAAAVHARDGFIFTNCVDFDMLYGHRNDPEGYARALEYFDAQLDDIVEAMGNRGILFITADHGCDPTTPGTDHSREYVPLLAAGRAVKAGTDLGTRHTFADLGATVAGLLGVAWDGPGTSFADGVV